MTAAWMPKPYVQKLKDPLTPNMGGREGAKIDMITLHFTKGMGALGTAKWMQENYVGASAHFYVDRKGPVYQLVPLNMRAWHHGESKVWCAGAWRTSATDRCAVGIEMANCGHMVKADDGHYYFTFKEDPRRYPLKKFGEPVKATLKFDNGKEQSWYWEPYPQELVDSVTRLTVDLVQMFDVPIKRIVGHEDVAIPLGNRKFDPGPLWDWKGFISEVCDRLGVPVPGDVWKLHKTVG